MSSKGKEAYKYDKIYQKKGKLTKKNLGTKSWDEADSDFKTRWNKYGHSNEGKDYRVEILYMEPESVLDVGCGHNEMVKGLREKGIDSIGMDCSCPSADVIASAHDLPFDDNSFDLLISFDCMEHIPEEEVEESFSEFARVSNRIFLKISLTKNSTFIDGEMLHTCVKLAEWWVEIASRYFSIERQTIHKKGTPWEHLILYGTTK